MTNLPTDDWDIGEIQRTVSQSELIEPLEGMLPIDNIRVSDQFQNPLFPDGVIFCVEEVNYKEKMVKIQPYSFKTCTPFGKPFWKKNSDRLFSESWRLN